MGPDSSFKQVNREGYTRLTIGMERRMGRTFFEMKNKNCLYLHADRKESIKRKNLKIEEKEDLLMKQGYSKSTRTQDGKHSGQMTKGRKKTLFFS